MKKRGECMHEDGYGTMTMDGVHCFLCMKRLNISQSRILQNIEIRKGIEQYYDELENEGWAEGCLNGDVMERIKKILEVKDEK